MTTISFIMEDAEDGSVVTSFRSTRQLPLDPAQFTPCERFAIELRDAIDKIKAG